MPTNRLNAAALLIALLAGYSPSGRAAGPVADAPAPSLDQSKLCIFRNLQNTGACQVGQRAILSPDPSVAREELSLLFASQFCDLRYAVVVNAAGVVCIYNPTAQKNSQTSESANAAAAALVDAFMAAEAANASTEQ